MICLRYSEKRRLRCASLFLVIVVLGWAVPAPAVLTSDRAETLNTPQEVEAAAARKWILNLPKPVRKWLKTVQHQPTKPGEPWGLFTFCEDARIPYSIVSTCIAWGCADMCGGIEKLPGYHPKAKEEMAAWVQKFQDPKTHQFIDPLHESCVAKLDDPAVRYSFREAVTKYAYVMLTSYCDSQPLYPYTPGSNAEGKFDPTNYLKFIKNGDWDKHAWGIGSHAAAQTVRLFEMVNAGHDEFVPTLTAGTEFILSQQNPRTGMWGVDKASLAQQIGGAIKVIGRFQFHMGLVAPHMDQLADSIIANHQSGAFYKTDGSPCVPRNVSEMAYACMEVSDYRRDELHAVFAGLVAELKRYRRADGSFSETWGGTNAVGWCQSVVSPRANKPRADLVGASLVLDTLNRVYDRAGWTGGTWEKPKYWRTALKEANQKYEISCDANGKVSVTLRNQ